jgi:N-acetylglucosaminyldiphosphoundecaprenol N-acetyl-beta-D-mannosaminyltransferase
MSVAAAANKLARVELAGLRLHALTEAQCVDHIITELRELRGGWVVTPNLDHLRRYQGDREFQELVGQADLITPDGMPLIWFSRLQGTPLPERVAGSSLISSLSSASALEGRSIYLMGGDPGTAEEAGHILCERYPGLRLAGTSCPQVGNTIDEAMRRGLIAELEKVQPDIIFVGLGSPKQERLIAALRPFLPHAWWLGVGISFSFVCKRVKRAPRWMQKLGLEWIHRLWQEPRRLAKRYLIDGLPFAGVMFARCGWRRISGRRNMS